ncbi:hypothetical protein A3Q34_00730 [Colwellia sp. PAMC 20917]|nr:hypothetical protein A3Q34_00730 [Colwellia sp. PAMC 20917]
MSCSLFAKDTIPEPLTPWVSWVLKGHENLSCPFINNTNFAEKQNHICAWPSTLVIDVTDSSATFKQSWQVLTKSIIPLPGNVNNWPLAVKVNNKDFPVFSYKGKPAIELGKGTYVIAGQFEWSKIPQSIAIPEQYAFVKMTINNQVIAFPKIENNELWLQKFETSQEQQDSLDITVARRIADGAYIKLETFMSINVSGQMREVKLGKVLPEGFELIGIESPVSSFLDGDGILHAKVKPGSWEIKVLAYAPATLLTWQKPEQSHHWPKEEIWVFEGHENLRLGKVEGAKMVDSSQANMPNAWYELPSYLVNNDDSLRYDIQHRGKPLHLENQLNLKRTLWLSFDHSTYTFNDDINGAMINDWRLSMKSPYLLESAEDQDGSVLITTKEPNERGIENRYPQVKIEARGIINSAKQLPVSGWNNDFERVSLKLNLPPGNKLFAVFGADTVSNSWWSSWSIWASFIVLLSSLMASRLINVTAGIATAVMLLFIYQEINAPVIAILNLLLAIVIKKHQPFERMKVLVKAYWGISITVAIGAILLFSATQLRTVIHPQLESRESSADSYRERVVVKNKEAQMSRKRSDVISSADLMSAPVERIIVSGSQVKMAELMMERYQSDALMQAGSGIPSWQWNSYQINWNSPVAKDQTFEVIVLSKTIYRFIKILGILLTLIWLFLILKEVISEAYTKIKPPAVASMLALLFLMPSYIPNVEAADFPNQKLLDELKVRLTEAPSCVPDCVAINRLHVSIDEKELTLVLSVHANTATALALPKSEFWRPEKLLLGETSDENKIESLVNYKGWIYIPIAQGLSTITLWGQVAPVDEFQLEFKDKPKHVNISSSVTWEIVGRQADRLTGNTLAFLATNTDKKENENQQISTRYSTQPFVKVTRELTVDQLWTIRTKVERIAPNSGSINIKVPLIAGENITSAEVIVEDNQVAVTLPAGVNFFTWTSIVAQQQDLRLHAKPEQPLIELWRVIVSPAWHANLSGLPIILEDQDNNDYYRYSFYPYPGESLDLTITRPVPVKGEVLAIDSVNYTIEQGTRTSTLSLSFDYRSTRGGEHIIELPRSYQLKEIRTDNKLINLQLEADKLAIPVLPGKHNVQILMRASVEEEMLFSAPKINLNAPISNITSIINLSSQRWILSAKGPLLGPAVLYWGELLAFILLALLVSRVNFSPLNTVSWIILGFGLSLSNWGVLMLMALWFAAITASTYRPKNINRLSYNASQVLLYLLSIVAIVSLLLVVPASLLSSPSMGIEGNYSYGNHLQWFSDKSSGLLPQVSVVSISTIFYKGIMLVWVIWLSFAFLSWIKWAWKALGQQGYWRSELSKQLDEK